MLSFTSYPVAYDGLISVPQPSFQPKPPAGRSTGLGLSLASYKPPSRSMMETFPKSDMSTCAVCTNLTALHHRTSVRKISVNAIEGCNECSLLEKILRTFEGFYRQATEINWVVDSSLRITLLKEKGQQVGALEVFTSPGGLGRVKSFRSRADLFNAQVSIRRAQP